MCTRVRYTSMVALLVLLVAGGAMAQDLRRVFPPPTPSLSIQGEQGYFYGKALPSAAWHVGQWGNPSGDISDFADGVAANRSLSVTARTGPVPEIAIAQSGALLPCESKGAPREFDGFIGTNAREGFVVTEPLAKYRSLVQSVDMKVLSGRVPRTAADCKVSKAVSLICIVFTNAKAKSTLFFQIILFALNNSPRDVWWARGADQFGQHHGRFGYNFIASTAKETRPTGANRRFEMDLMPIVSNLIQSNSVGMDPDLSHWFISGAYFGNAVFGHVDLTTAWSGYQLEGSLR